LRSAAFIGQHAAVFREKSEQLIHVSEIRAVIQEPASAAHINEPRPLQFLEVK
jgi:hypothetical protein